MKAWKRWAIGFGIAVAALALLRDLSFLERAIIATFALVGYAMHTLGQAIDAARAETAALRQELREHLHHVSAEGSAGLERLQRAVDRIESNLAEQQPADASDSRF